MIRIFAMVLIACYAWENMAHQRDEQIAVARYLIDSIAHASDAGDCVEPNETNIVHVAYPDYSSLFETIIPAGHAGSDWTPQEKQEAFEVFMMDVPAMAQTNTVRNLRFLVETALAFADERKAADAMRFAQNILSSSCEIGGSRAAQIFEDRVRPTLEMNAFVETAITRRRDFVDADYLAAGYAAKLLRGIGELDYAVVTNGASVLRRTLRGGYTARQMDKLYLALHPGYGVSSNRLALAEWALRNQDEHPSFYEQAVRDYFVPVTNDLHGAAQPLPEVDGL